MIDSSLPIALTKVQKEIENHARDYGLDFFDTIFEFLDYDELNAVAAGGGFPKRYPHWRTGMIYDQLSVAYTWGMQKIYELVINTDPCYAYLMNSNSHLDQKLIMAHVYGHSDFFKNNYCFKQTNRKMLDQMANHGVRIRRYVDKYGQDKVESFIDKCLSIENLIDPYAPFIDNKNTIDESSEVEPKSRLNSPRLYLDSFINPKEYVEEQEMKIKRQLQKSKKFPVSPDRDILKFIIDYGQLNSWESDILSIIREESYYFAPQRVTKIMNEGWASYWHSKIMTEKALDSSELIDFADRHSGIMVVQPNQINPYKLGIELFRYIEDRWNTGKFGKEYEDCDNLTKKKNWHRDTNEGKEKIFSVRSIHNDITFIDTFFTEEFSEQERYYTYGLNPRTGKYEIKTRDWREVKEEILTDITNGSQPVIQVKDGNYLNQGGLLLEHRHHGRDLDLKTVRATMANVSALWGRAVSLDTMQENKKFRYTYSEEKFSEQRKN